MSRKESKFYAINFIEPRIVFFKKKVLTPRAMKTHIQISHKKVKSRGAICVQRL